MKLAVKIEINNFDNRQCGCCCMFKDETQCKLFQNTLDRNGYNDETERCWECISMTMEEEKMLGDGVQFESEIQADGKQYMGARWHTDDIIGVAEQKGWEDISIEDANSILDSVISCHDASVGINWEVIDQMVDDYMENK